MRRWFALLAVLLMLLPGCTGNTPPKVTAEFLDCLIRGDIKSAEKLTLSGHLTLETGSKAAAALYTPLLSAMQYSMGGSLIDAETATVNLTLLTVDLEELMSQVAAEMILRMMIDGGKGSGDLFYTLLLEKLREEDVPMESYTVTAALKKEKGRWKIDMEESPTFARAIGGGVRGLLLSP